MGSVMVRFKPMMKKTKSFIHAAKYTDQWNNARYASMLENVSEPS